MAAVSLGQAIRRLRRAAGLSQRELADRLGVDASHLCRVETDRREPSLSLLRGISSELDVPVGLLLGTVLVIELPEESRQEYGSVISRLLASASAAQLPLPLAQT